MLNYLKGSHILDKNKIIAGIIAEKCDNIEFIQTMGISKMRGNLRR